MGFQYGLSGATRVGSGVTPYLIHSAMAQAMRKARVVDPSRVLMVLDDQRVPKEQPVDDAFITVRYPGYVWDQGDVYGGDNNNAPLSALMLSGQTRHTLWLMSERDLYGTADTLVDEATGRAPAGAQLIGQMLGAFWEQDLVDEAGNALTSRPLRFLSYEPPEDLGGSEWRPFRITWELYFTYDLNKGG